MSILSTLFGEESKRFGPSWPQEPIVHHGDPARFPEVMRGGELSVHELSTRHAGRLEVAGPQDSSQIMFKVTGPANYFLHTGLSLAFKEVEGTVPALAAWAAELERELGLPPSCVEVDVFAHPPGGRAQVHFDAFYVFILQLEGRKTLSLGLSEVRYPIAGVSPEMMMPAEAAVQCLGRPPAPDSLVTVELEPGSAVFMPPGCWHTTRHEAFSLSASIAFKIPRPMDLLLGALRLQLAADPLWRRPMWRAWGEGEADRAAAARQMAELLDRLPAACQGLRAEEILQGVPEVGSGHLTEGSWFYREPSMSFSPVGEGELEITSPWGLVRTALEMEPPFVAACGWVAEQRGAFSVRGLLDACPELSVEDAKELVSALAAAGALQPIPQAIAGRFA